MIKVDNSRATIRGTIIQVAAELGIATRIVAQRMSETLGEETARHYVSYIGEQAFVDDEEYEREARKADDEYEKIEGILDELTGALTRDDREKVIQGIRKLKEVLKDE